LNKKKSRPLSGLGPRLLHSWPRPRASPVPKTDMVTQHDLGDLMMSHSINWAIRMIRRPN
jgi:hypothetical protein